MAMESRLEVFTGNANPKLAQEIVRHLGIPLGILGSAPLAMVKSR